MKTLSVKLPDYLAGQLRELSERRGERRSTLVRRAIEALVAGQRHDPRESCRDLARDLEGSVAGPADLSHDPRHAQGYGQ